MGAEMLRVAWQGKRPGAMCYDAMQVPRADPAMFDPAYYGARAEPVAVGGRQSAWFVDGDCGPAVLRHYRRGGMVARISRQRYIWLGEARTRCFREFRLLESLAAQGLPVPAPLAAAYWRVGALTYEAAILVRRLPDVRPLARMLQEPVWDAAADAIARMHQAGVWHADLNAYNILLDARGKAWIIDFDRGRQGGVSGPAKRRNMERLQRSLVKVGGAAGQAFFERLNQAYQNRMARAPA
ncbi:3-deoxy-D-manno-octulosonic acid kinase [Bordetella genomosp. 9]|uniref:3-deoxy-D-manno-octulosonic acid kinase n=1 Tax=Bordetella genomosp. 9 TaxID=1416803 RepID=UPI000A295023|nr:3-deoxy-D-manno-octulosonic acid kinase [Bordetella genomosp. 9]ARP90102.1 3-deoxy-D-manno-octulosonic acid kinase [Bordetella genomosp. 9]